MVRGNGLTDKVPAVGYSSSHDVQEPCQLCDDDPFLAAYREKDLDKRTALGRIHPVCEDHSTSLVWGASTASKGTASRSGRQAAELEERVARICDQEGAK